MKVSNVRVGFQIFLHLVLILHILGYYYWGWTSIGSLDFPSFFKDGLSHWIVTAGVIFAGVAFLGTLFFGRIFCSWGCHFGAVQDFSAWVLKKLGWKPPHLKTRFLHWTPYLLLISIFLIPAISANLNRQGAPAPSLDLAMNEPWEALPGVLGSVITFVVCGAVILLFLGTRGFCRFVCPYGAVFRIFDRVAPLRIRKNKPCSGSCSPPTHGSCTLPEKALEPPNTKSAKNLNQNDLVLQPTPTQGSLSTQPTPTQGSLSTLSHGSIPPCTSACPTAIDVHNETELFGRVKDSDCIRCHLCIEACPEKALSYSTKKSFQPQDKKSSLKSVHTLTLGQEFFISIFFLSAYFAYDLVIAAHFLAASLAASQAFLLFHVVKAWKSDHYKIFERFPIRRNSIWTRSGSLLLALTFISLVPFFQGLSFKWLQYRGNQAFNQVFQPSPTSQGSTDLGKMEFSVDSAALKLHRENLQQAQRAYELALELFPKNSAVRKKYVYILVAQRDPRAIEEVKMLQEFNPGELSNQLYDWTLRNFPKSEQKP